MWKWEPGRCCDTVDVSWSKLADLSIHEGKLLGRDRWITLATPLIIRLVCIFTFTRTRPSFTE